ncbi:MAG TPA: hypothetical protein PKL97_09405 [Candidatus Omnitrophota bacterium]|nr:hypothetical protein [Candidatus Omnitrophota bacterium]
MSRNTFKVISVFIACLMLASVCFAQPTEGMNQGEFALWLVKAVGAMGKLPTGANAQDAFDFLTGLGMVPQGGWQADGTVTKAFLASLLDLPESEVNALMQDPDGFNKLLDKVYNLLQSRFDDARSGVFRVQSASGSVPA